VPSGGADTWTRRGDRTKGSRRARRRICAKRNGLSSKGRTLRFGEMRVAVLDARHTACGGPIATFACFDRDPAHEHRDD
jgi:hypothetical protein